mmetsp:Transcript_40209/g.91066  ORF Transcript_40209/g.91066 Transcript_40209/m.91066 type:complete len:321 (-) Transcript_40209:441-1403(-)
MITGAAAALVGDALFVGHRARHRIARAPTPSLGTQVITDIDDTVKSSGGIALAGIPLGGVDTSVTRNSFYPGVFQFGLEVAMASARFGSLPEPMAILTARAREFKWALEIKQSSKLCTSYRMAGEERGLAGWGVGPVLYGSVQEWICQERKGWRKFENFKLLQEVANKKTKYVFIGDNGSSEKDLEAAQMIIEAFPGKMRAVFIHAVSGTEQPAPLPEDEMIEGVEILYFRTYPTAALKAAKAGLLSANAVERVCEAAEAGMAADPDNFTPGSTNEQLVRSSIDEARALPSRTPLVGTLASLLTRPFRRKKPSADETGSA